MLSPCLTPCLLDALQPAIPSGVTAQSGASLAGASLATNGTTITLIFSDAVSFGAGGSGGLVVRGELPANGAVVANYVSGSGTNTLVFELASEFYQTEVLGLYYTQPGDGIQNDATGDDVASFSNRPVTNGSTVGDGVIWDELGRPIPDENGRAIPYTL